MSNFTPSNLVKGQTKFNQQFLSGEWRAPDSAGIMTANTGAKANPMIASLRGREDRPVSAYLPVRQAATNGTGRVYNHTGNNGDSQEAPITWTEFSETFSISRKLADNNVFDFSEMFASEQLNAIYNLVNRIDAWFVNQCLADKTQVNVGGGQGNFNGGNNNYEVAQADRALFYENVKAMMQQNLYQKNLTAIVDSRANVLAREVGNQGTGNAVNTQYQLLGYDNVAASTRTILDVPTTYTESGIFFETGSVGLVPWIPPLNRKALDPEKAMSRNGDYGQVSIPNLGMDFAVSAYTERADTSANNGSAQDDLMQYELSIDLGFVPTPLSDFRGADDSVIYTAGVLA
jgi:hypothetical protein